jgi:hypothetical protein
MPALNAASVVIQWVCLQICNHTQFAVSYRSDGVGSDLEVVFVGVAQPEPLHPGFGEVRVRFDLRDLFFRVDLGHDADLFSLCVHEELSPVFCR